MSGYILFTDDLCWHANSSTFSDIIDRAESTCKAKGEHELVDYLSRAYSIRDLSFDSLKNQWQEATLAERILEAAESLMAEVQTQEERDFIGTLAAAARRYLYVKRFNPP